MGWYSKYRLVSGGTFHSAAVAELEDLATWMATCGGDALRADEEDSDSDSDSHSSLESASDQNSEKDDANSDSDMD
ncbi:hypothetical protein PGT21_028422 [Puccinia graminis f. sp. tritici]|uniref:Uncharacterized protein n=1 Tax=Puccinia graminis f. sp. tritici TaxID=56615 RepID=A0A5B0NGW6_PUCGR|nr:hypothetical protein PGT21_028422 [Puccinia graminis f. sp. tritici]